MAFHALTESELREWAACSYGLSTRPPSNYQKALGESSLRLSLVANFSRSFG